MHCGAYPEDEDTDFMHDHPKVCPKHDSVSVREAAENWVRLRRGEDPWADAPKEGEK
jgi:hypothetical protein